MLRKRNWYNEEQSLVFETVYFWHIGQLELKKARILVVGVGGLGCPAATYLVAAGLGTVGLVDSDNLELTNLHRQILYTTDDIDHSKVQSAANRLRKLNPHVQINVHDCRLCELNCVLIVGAYDIVLDCTDNVKTRYMLNDVCVLLQRPLVSGAAVGLEGQLTVYNYKDSPCYRCLYPQPPPPENVSNCSDYGVLGVVPGIIGSLQALECIRLIVSTLEPAYNRRLLLYDAVDGSFRSVSLRPRNTISCLVCSQTFAKHANNHSSRVEYSNTDMVNGDNNANMATGHICHDTEFVQQEIERLASLINASCTIDVQPACDIKHVTPANFMNHSGHKLLIDVRDKHETEICAADILVTDSNSTFFGDTTLGDGTLLSAYRTGAGSVCACVNVPLRKLRAAGGCEQVFVCVRELCRMCDKEEWNERDETENLKDDLLVGTICWRGNDSQLAVMYLKSHSNTIHHREITFASISGGLYAWSEEFQPEMKLC